MLRKRALLKILVALTLTLGILLVLGLTVHAAEYDLRLEDVWVTDDNKTDILKDKTSFFERSASYDSENQILTVSGRIGGAGGSVWSQIDGLTICVNQDAYLTGAFVPTLRLEYDTIIKGKGTLSIWSTYSGMSGGASGYPNEGISSQKKLTLDQIFLDLTGPRGMRGSATSESPEESFQPSLEIVSSYVKSEGSIEGFSGGIILEGCQIVSPEGAYIKDGTIFTSEGQNAENIVIAPDPTHVVIPNALNVRKEAGTDSERIGGVTAGKEVIVFETQGEWSKIVYGTGFGWVQSKYLKEIEKATYTVTFDANGGSGTMPTMTVQEGEKLTLPECTFTPPEGKVFDRWIAGNPGEQVDIGGDSKIRAFWKDAESSGLANPFVDIYETDDYYDAVLWAYYATPQVTNGMDETHFGPQLTVTRGQAVTFLWRSMGCPEPISTYNPFVDVPSTEYSYKPILWAVEQGITKGVDETHFNPMDTLSTQHIVTFLYRTKNPGMDGWNGEAAAWASQGYGGKPFGVDIAVNNTTPCPRCNVVQFLYKLSK